MLSAPTLVADSTRSTVLAPGLTHRWYWIAKGPWAVHVLEADRASCWSPVAVKAGGARVGRARTSELALLAANRVARGDFGGAINADFFRFDPPGVPLGAHVEDGRIITRAAPARPVFALDSLGQSWMGLLQDAPDSVNFLPIRPREAVGGFPIVLSGGAIAPRVDSAGGAGFGPARHPRTAVALGENGRRLMFVVVDGRQPGYSVGVSLRELAELLVGLGATEGINLDGGGSSAMVLAAEGGPRVVNRPSDAVGERPVANALALVRDCGRTAASLRR